MAEDALVQKNQHATDEHPRRAESQDNIGQVSVRAQATQDADIPHYAIAAERGAKLLKKTSSSSKLAGTISKMIETRIQIATHLQEARNSQKEWNGRVFAAIPIGEGRLSYTFWNNDRVSVREVQKMTSSNTVASAITFYRSGGIKWFHTANDEESVNFFESGELESYFIRINGTNYSANWSVDGTVTQEVEEPAKPFQPR